MALTLAMYVFGVTAPLVGPFNGFDLFVAGAGLLMGGIFVVQTFAKARMLAKQDAGAPVGARLASIARGVIAASA